MVFILGAFGNNIHATYAQRMAHLEASYTLSTEHLMVIAGNKQDTLVSDYVYPVGQEEGVCVGKIFGRDDYKPAKFSSGIDPQTFMKNFWGRYVGVVHDKAENKIVLMRDPQGLSTLFYSITPDGIIFSTDLSMLYDMCDDKPDVNYDYFAHYLLYQNHALPITPLKNIYELLPGMSLSFDLSCTTKQELLWDVSSAHAKTITDPRTFEEELRHTLISSLSAWTAQSDGICLELSGGLDSSALMIMLREIYHQDKKIIGVNYIDSKTPSSNEVAYAQEVADMCNVPLYFSDWQQCSVLDTLPSSWRPNKPSSYLLFHKMNEQLNERAQQHECSEIMNGQGGDHIFLAPAPESSLADYWLAHGFRGIKKPLSELASINRTSWSLLTKNALVSIKNYYRGSMIGTAVEAPYLEDGYYQQLTPIPLYLDEQYATFYPAKAEQLRSFHHAVTEADTHQRFNNRLVTHPLLFQPVVELGLAIPTYQSFAGDFDRIFLRNVASRIKNPAALWRMTKGQTTGTIIKAFSRDNKKIEDFLMQGSIVRSGMINTDWLLNALAQIKHGQHEPMWPVMHLTSAQRWLNQWRLS